MSAATGTERTNGDATGERRFLDHQSVTLASSGTRTCPLRMFDLMPSAG
jgi:hypothetical protein